MTEGMTSPSADVDLAMMAHIDGFPTQMWQAKSASSPLSHIKLQRKEDNSSFKAN